MYYHKHQLLSKIWLKCNCRNLHLLHLYFEYLFGCKLQLVHRNYQLLLILPLQELHCTLLLHQQELHLIQVPEYLEQ